MRDIRPNPISRRRRTTLPDLTPPAPLLLPPATLPAKTAFPKRITGSSVPVTSVHVSRQNIAGARPEIETPAEYIPSKEFQEAGGKKRPLFAKPELVPKKVLPKLTPMRVGHKERFILAGLFALILVAVGIAGFIFLPSATITLSLETAPLLVDQKLTVRSANTENADIIPGSAFSRDINVTATIPVTSREVVGAKATGTVEIVNRTTQDQKIKEHSRLVTKDGTLFYMQKWALLPAASQGSVTRATVTVEADKAGAEGNIQPQRLDFAGLDKSAQPLLYAEAVKSLTGGSGEEVAVVKDADIESAKKSAGDMAKSQAEQDIRAQLPKGWTILEESWDEKPIEFNTDAIIDSRQPSISFTAKVNVKVMGFEDAKFQKSLSDALSAKLDKDYMLFPGPISFTKSVDTIDWDKGETTLAVRVTHKTVPTFSIDALKDKLSGLAQTEATQYLQGLKGVKTVQIDLWPFWVHTIPSINNRVNVIIKSEQ